VVRSAHVDTFARDNLPPECFRPDFIFHLPELNYPERLNACVELLDRSMERGFGNRICTISDAETLTYTQLAERVNRIANVLTKDVGILPGNRVLLRSANNAMMLAATFAVFKAGGVAVATMPLLRAKEIAHIAQKAKVSISLCDSKLSEEMEKAELQAPELQKTIYWGPNANSLESLMARPGYESFDACDTAADDVCLMAFTSGTTGQPKGVMQFHRDLLSVCDTYGKYVLQATADDRFIGSPPIAFAFGLGGLALFPMRVGASTVLLEKAPPVELLNEIEKSGATICFTAPTAYRAMLPHLRGRDLSSLRKCVSAGEVLPKSTWQAWYDATGIKILDGIGSTELMHIFIGSPEATIRPGALGKPVPGYEAKIIDESGKTLPPNTQGRLAVRGPTGCRYLADDRQKKYVENGWNITGDICLRDDDGYFWYQARSDDMIISAGYNIAAPEVEEALLVHPAVAECAVVGTDCPERGQLVTAYVVVREGFTGDDALTKQLQDFVKAEIAPFKYPRLVRYLTALPKTDTGKLQRGRLREPAA
jgi:2-aminobenzoate-CoA ligase